MVASGQLGKDLKKEYIKDKQDNFQNGNDPSLNKTFTPDDDALVAPEYFSHVKNKLHLNSDAMIPVDEPLTRSKPSAQNNPPQTPPQTQQMRPPPKQDDKEPTKKEIITEKLEKLADKSSDVLLKVSTVFPFTLFTHDIIVDPYKVNVVFREFFYSEHIHSIMVKDILDVVVETSVFFATVKIVDQGYTENSVNVSYLKREDALKLRKIIQGLVIAHRQAVDLSVLNPAHIKDKAEELGTVEGIDNSVKNVQ
jgi:hypothetical protein